MCTQTLDHHNFSPDSVFSAAFPDGSSSPAAMDAEGGQVRGAVPSLPFSPAETLYGVDSLLIDDPAGTLPNLSAISSPETPSCLPPLTSLDEASPFSHSDHFDYAYPYNPSPTKRWLSGWSPTRKESPGDSTLQSPQYVDDGDCSEEPSWLRWHPPTSPLRLTNQSLYRRSDSPEKMPLYSDFLLSETETEMEPTGVGAGLRNLGNTCFLNVILQCFTHTVPLVQALHSFNHRRPCENFTPSNLEFSSSRRGFCVLCLLSNHIEKALSSSGSTIAPVDLVDNLSNISSFFRRYQQEDAHEFLQCLLDRLDACCMDSETNDDMSPQSNKLVEQIFGGRLISKLLCCNCGHSSNTYEPLIDLSLEIEDVDSLPSALESFTKVEMIEDTETMFTCENCMEAVSVEKQLVLDQAPSIAMFHLKRFKSDGSSVMKIDKHVEYPLELDLGPYTYSNHDDNVELKYDLYAVVVHVGFTPSSGHYFCFVRSSPETWHRLDDSMVYRVQCDYVLSQDAYILFYARKGTPWFSSSMESLKTIMTPFIINKSPKSVLDNAENTLWPSGVSSDSFEDNGTRDASDGSSTKTHGEGDIYVISTEMQDASEGISTGRYEEAEVDATTNAAEEISTKLLCGLRDGLLHNECRCDNLVNDTLMGSKEGSSCGGTSNNYEKFSKSLNNGCSSISDTMKSDIIRNGSSSMNDTMKSEIIRPRISPDPIKSADGCYLVSRDLLRSKDCKKQSRKDSNKREAHRYLARSGCPYSRSVSLAAAVNENNEVKRKKKRVEASSAKVSPRATRLKSRRRKRGLAI